jgi:hypothetical protein
MLFRVNCPNCNHVFYFLETPQDEAIVNCYICANAFVVNTSIQCATQLLSKASIRKLDEVVVTDDAQEPYYPEDDSWGEGSILGLSYRNPLFLKNGKFISSDADVNII